jgi:hypothetical protein
LSTYVYLNCARVNQVGYLNIPVVVVVVVVAVAVAAANFKLLNICKFTALPSTVYGCEAQSFKERMFGGNINK